MPPTKRAALRRAAAGKSARFLLLAALVVAACGYGPQPDFTGQRPSDGIGAWEDLGAVQLCLGNQRIGAPGAGPGGFCVDQNTPNEDNCRADADCGSRETCVCGRCTAAFCDSNAECGGGRGCNFQEKRCATVCSDAADCAPGELCSGGFCRGGCSDDDDCQYAEICSSQGRCVVSSCAAPGDCLAGEICKIQREARVTAEPTALAGVDGEPLVLWLEMSDPSLTTSAIWRAVSDDGVRYRLDPATPVVEDGVSARAPSVVRTASGLVLFYETDAGIRRADATDEGGTSFAAATTVIPGDVHAPGAAVLPDGELLVYVHTGDHAGLALWRGSGAPAAVLGPAEVTLPELWRDVTRVGSPYVLVDDALGLPAVRVWFDAFGAESGDSIQFGEVVPLPPNDSVGYAAATVSAPGDLVPYAYNPVFDRVAAFLDHRAERAPAVVHAPAGTAGEPDLWFLYYGAASGDGMTAEGVGVARHPPRVAAE